MAIDKFDDWLDAMAKPGNEGGKTGQVTKIKAKPGHAPNTAMGRWQMTRTTRRATYNAMGYKGPKAEALAEHKYRTDPNFERTVARTALVNIDNSLKGKHTASDDARTIAWTKTWYAGNPDFPDNQIPAGNVNEQPYMGEYVEGLMKTLGKTYNYSGPRWRKQTAPTQSTTSTQLTTPTQTLPMGNPAKTKALENNKLADAEGKSTDVSITPIKRKQRMAAIAQRLVDMPEIYTPEKEESKKQPSRLANIGENVMPYLSNLYNLGVKPAMVPSPILGQPVSYQRMSMDADRYQIESDAREIQRNAGMTLDASTAMRAMMAAKAAKFGQMSKVNEAERNVNAEISNKEREANMAIDAVNRAALYNYRQQQAERENAIKADRTANVANASDKYIAQQTRKAQQDLEERKMEIMARYDQFKNLKYLMGEEDEETPKEETPKKETPVAHEAMGGYLPKKGMGGKLYTAGRFMKTLKPIKTIK